MSDVPRIDVSELSPAKFERYFRDPSAPVVLKGSVSLPLESFSLESFANALGEETMAARCYGNSHLAHPEAWEEAGYCSKQVQLTGGEYRRKIETGEALREDTYVVSDFSKTPIGVKLGRDFDTLADKLGLKITHFGTVITAWWGPPGHTEPVHCDIVDGTLWQLAGEKRVVLVPPDEWENLYPFPFKGPMSWSFCRTLLRQPDVAKYPRLKSAIDKSVEVVLHPSEVLYIPAGWAHEVTGIAGEHVLSANRFWHTPMGKVWFLPVDVIEGLVPEPARTQLLAYKAERRRVLGL